LDSTVVIALEVAIKSSLSKSTAVNFVNVDPNQPINNYAL